MSVTRISLHACIFISTLSVCSMRHGYEYDVWRFFRWPLPHLFSTTTQCIWIAKNSIQNGIDDDDVDAHTIMPRTTFSVQIISMETSSKVDNAAYTHSKWAHVSWSHAIATNRFVFLSHFFFVAFVGCVQL